MPLASVQVSPILQPVVALLMLNCIMLVWLYILRLPAVQKQGIVLDASLPRGEQMSSLPPKVRWKADNYNHLLEQPLLFYVACLVLAVLGAGDGLNLMLAWAYVGLRTVHSFHQALWNHIPIRFLLFAASSVVLIALVISLALAVF